MIEARIARSFDALAARLRRLAEALVEARAERRPAADAENPGRWRSASWLWPGFGEG